MKGDKRMKIGKLIMAISIALMISGCGYKGSLLVKDNEVIAHSNRPMEITKTIDKDGNTSVTYSSKKSAGILQNLLTILSLGLIKK